ncbi:MAG: hypothetical protein LBD31_10475 [Treponema sp.]|jgi:phosphoribosyl 1,2-cyclic phosphate phosphodiesterase|nr:hypothetical protein [Treponema sp.]
MKLLFLGTAAAEGIPAIFCSCPVCRTARERKGKDIRTRSQALLDRTILFDFPPDTYAHYISSGFSGCDLPAIRYLFITHSHGDHLYPLELNLRKPNFANPPLETLHIYGSRAVEEAFQAGEESFSPCNEFHRAKPFETLKAGDYRITPLPALHDRREECLFYAAEHEGKALLYAHDTGFFPPPVWDYFSKAALRFNLISLDCTTMMHKEGNNHMGIPDAIEVKKRLHDIGAADEKTVFVLNHFSHNGGLNHDELCLAAEKEGFIPAYDGLEIEI